MVSSNSAEFEIPEFLIEFEIEIRILHILNDIINTLNAYYTSFEYRNL